MDLNRLTKGERILGGSALALLILSILPFWVKWEFGDFTERAGAWSAYFGFLLKLALILALIALIFVILKAVGTEMTLPVPAWQIYLGLAALTLLLLLIVVVTGPKGDQGSSDGFEYSRGIALFLAPILGAGMAYGAFLHMGEEGGTRPSVTGGPTHTPPPPAT